MSDRNGLNDGDIFSVGDIFKNRELLRVGHVPDSERIVGRDEEIQQVANSLAPVVQSGPPENLIIYGKTGTGKSLVSRHVCRQARERAVENDVRVIHTYIDCSEADTETRVARKMANSVRDEVDPSVDIPSIGIGSAEYYQYLWDLLENVNAYIVILDEIDQLRDDEVLMQLSRAEETGKTDCFIGVISISNKIEYRDRLNERINSSLQDSEFIFHPYDAEQLKAILENRDDAFKEDALENAVIPKTAALAAQEHGDARKAIEILREAGRLAEKADDKRVTVDHLDDAQREAEINRFKEIVSGSTQQVQFILQALAYLTISSKDEMFATHRVHEQYKQIVREYGTEPISQDRVYRLLNEQTFLGVTESRHTGGGKNSGSYLEHRLMRDPEMVLEAIHPDSEFDIDTHPDSNDITSQSTLDDT